MIPFTQYMRPVGYKRQIRIDRPPDIIKQAEELIQHGAVFEIEELMTGAVSMTCERDDASGDREILAHELCSNDSEVITAVDRLVKTAHKLVHDQASIKELLRVQNELQCNIK